MDKSMRAVLVSAASLLLAASALAAVPQSENTTTISNDPGQCDRVQYGRRQLTFYAQEQRTLSPAAIGKLSVRPPRNGGVSVEGWDKNEISVTACKAVPADDEASAKSRLAGIRMRIEGGNVSAEGPGSDDWSLHFLVRVPANVNLELNTYNGPVDLRDVKGTIQARTTNGPISLKRCSGSIDAEAQNGPIALNDSSGKIRLSAYNGPLEVRLRDQQWTGEGLNASTYNGPLDLTIPSSYSSGVEVVSEGHSPFRCEPCTGANRTWDNDGTRRARLGTPGAPVLVRITTNNGPVAIRGSLQ